MGAISYEISWDWGWMTVPAAKKIIAALQELVEIAERE
jgi:hypothetical protein